MEQQQHNTQIKVNPIELVTLSAYEDDEDGFEEFVIIVVCIYHHFHMHIAFAMDAQQTKIDFSVCLAHPFGCTSFVHSFICIHVPAQTLVKILSRILSVLLVCPIQFGLLKLVLFTQNVSVSGFVIDNSY